MKIIFWGVFLFVNTVVTRKTRRDSQKNKSTKSRFCIKVEVEIPSNIRQELNVVIDRIEIQF